MASRSFRIFATKEDLLAIFLEFQSNMKVHYFECGQSNKLTEAQDITKEEFFRINIHGKHLGNQWLVCPEHVIPQKRKNDMLQDENIFFIDQMLNSSSVIVDIGGIYHEEAIFPTEISTIWYENSESKMLYSELKKICRRHSQCTVEGYMIGKNAFCGKGQYRFCTINIDSPEDYDLRIE